MNRSYEKEAHVKLVRGLLDLVVLQFLRTHPMHGYGIIKGIRKKFQVKFGPSTIYPLLSDLEEKGYLESSWNLDAERPRKVYKLTSEGLNLLDTTYDAFSLIRFKMKNIQNEPGRSTALTPIQKATH